MLTPRFADIAGPLGGEAPSGRGAAPRGADAVSLLLASAVGIWQFLKDINVEARPTAYGSRPETWA